MSKKLRSQIVLAQNFIRSSRLVRSLLDASSIESGDTVYEIGPGRGVITIELAQIARKVIAIEKDPNFARQLSAGFQRIENVKIISDDFLQVHIPDAEYKIFANIPYNMTAEIVRKILYTHPVPRAAYLIMQKEAAQKFSGTPNETQFSLLAKPLFDIQIIRELQRTDFDPVPPVDSVFLRIRKRPSLLIQKEDISLYRRFICYGFGRWKQNLKLSFKPVFTYPQWKHLSKELSFLLDATPSQLTFEQWLGLFECFKQRVPRHKQACINR